MDGPTRSRAAILSVYIRNAFQGRDTIGDMELPPLELEAAPPSFEETAEYAPLGFRLAARLVDLAVHFGMKGRSHPPVPRPAAARAGGCSP